MTSRDRLSGDSGIQDPDTRPEVNSSIGNPDLRPDVDSTIDNADIRPGDDVALHEVDDRPIERTSIAEEALQPMSGGPPVVPIAIVAGLVVVAIAAFSFLGGGSPSVTGSPAGAIGAGAVSTAGPTSGAIPPRATQAGGVGPAAPETANLVVTGADVAGTWTLDGGADVSPTSTLIAAVWAVTESDGATFADLITLTITGRIADGTQTTSQEGLGLGISISRSDAAGADVFNHVFASQAGECQVTMARTAEGLTGTFTCTGITDADGHTADASGSFAT